MERGKRIKDGVKQDKERRDIAMQRLHDAAKESKLHRIEQTAQPNRTP